MTIGFIGQGFIGKSYADDFEARGYTVVRYTRSEPFVKNRDAIAMCDIVFIAVPTPTTPQGFDASAVREVLKLVGRGKTAVIKSTLVPGTTKALQDEYSDIVILHSPEFLRERTAAHDAAHPDRNIVGMSADTPLHREHAERVLAVLPEAPYSRVTTSNESELIKYAGNVFLYMKVVYANLLYDLAAQVGSWEAVRDSVGADPRIGPGHLDPVHTSGHAHNIRRAAARADTALLRTLLPSVHTTRI